MTVTVDGASPSVTQQRDMQQAFGLPLAGAWLSAHPSPTALFDGDSKSGEPQVALRWLLSRVPMDVVVGGNIGVGGTGTGSSGSGLTSSARLASMAATVASAAAAGPVDMFLTIGTNDLGIANADTVVANVKTYAAAFFAAGGRYLVLMGVDPRTLGSNMIPSINAGYRTLSLADPNILYCDTGPAWQNYSSTEPLGTAGASGGVTTDGLHGSYFGNFRKQFAIEGVCRRLYRPREVSVFRPNDTYSLTARPRGNIVGANGRFTALGGTNSATNGTVNGTPPLGWTLSGDLRGLTVTFTTRNSTKLKAALGAFSDIPVVNMAFSGTVTGGTSRPQLGSSAIYSDTTASAPFESEFLGYFDNLSGIVGSALFVSNLNQVNAAIGVVTTSTVTADATLPTLDQLCWLSHRAAGTTNGMFFNQQFCFREGEVVSGSVDLCFASVRRFPTI